MVRLFFLWQIQMNGSVFIKTRRDAPRRVSTSLAAEIQPIISSLSFHIQFPS